MSQLIRAKRCPHCSAELPTPRPRSCPKCAGSLQQRFLQLGCLSSAPPLLLFGLGLYPCLRALAAAIL